MTVTHALAEAAHGIEQEYAQGDDRPLGTYAALIGTYAGAVATAVVALRASGVRLRERPAWQDLALVALATHKVSRRLTKEPVTSPLRAPFTRFEGPGGPGEVRESVPYHGWRHGVGELLTCPFCTSQWIATSFVLGLAAAPRQTRWVAGLFAAIAGSDALQFAYAWLERVAEGKPAATPAPQPSAQPSAQPSS